MKFKVIYADPPWNYNRQDDRGCPYPTMPVEEICALRVAEISDKDAVLFMWATWPFMAQALEVISAWGFEYKTCGFVWVKTYPKGEPNQARLFPEDSFASFWGMGNWTRANTEFCLIATKGKVPAPEDRGVHQLIYSEVEEHSKKPDEARRRIERLMGDVPRLEMFCRFPAPGWAVWGNEVACDVAL